MISEKLNDEKMISVADHRLIYRMEKAFVSEEEVLKRLEITEEEIERADEVEIE